MKERKTIFMCGLIALALMFGGIAQANTISGSLWAVSNATASNAIPANVPGTPADVTFDVNSPFNFSGTGVSVGTWLASSGAFNEVGTLAALARLMSDGTTSTLVEFEGFVTVVNGQTFTVTHDDGLTLTIGALNMGFNPGPTSPTTSTATYTGPSGNFAFQLVYGECCGGPAVLQVDLPFTNAVPEPATMLLLGLGLVGLAGIRRRMHK